MSRSAISGAMSSLKVSRSPQRHGPPAYAKYEYHPNGDLSGRIMHRVTSKVVMRKWAMRFFTLSATHLRIFKADKMQRKARNAKVDIALSPNLGVTNIYAFKDDAPAVPGPKRAWQFKINVNVKNGDSRPPKHYNPRWPAKQVIKLGHTSRQGAHALREAVVGKWRMRCVFFSSGFLQNVLEEMTLTLPNIIALLFPPIRHCSA